MGTIGGKTKKGHQKRGMEQAFSLRGAAEKRNIGNIQDKTGFQGKCDSFRALLFAANGTTPKIPPHITLKPLIDIADQFTPVTPTEIQVALQETSMKCAAGSDGIPWATVVAVHNAIPQQLCNISNALLTYNIHPTRWKKDK